MFHLAQLLGLSQPGPIGFTAQQDPEPAKGRSIILLQEGDKSFGITVDSVVKMLPLEEVSAPAAEVKGINTKLVRGVRFDDDQEIILLSFERLFHAG